MWWQEHWPELLFIGAVAIAWGRLSQQMNGVKESLDLLTAKVGEQNGRVGKAEQAIAHINGEIGSYRERT